MTDISNLNSAINSAYDGFMDDAESIMTEAAKLITDDGSDGWEADMVGYNTLMMKAQIVQQAANSHMKQGNEMIGNIIKSIDAATDKISSAVERTVG